MQQQITELKRDPATASLVGRWPTSLETVLGTAIAIQSIAAPTFEERGRALYVEEQFRAIGLSDVSCNEIGNVYGRTPGLDSSRGSVVVSAHLDTVFPASTDLTIRRDDPARRISGPGLGDNSLGLAAMLELARAIQADRFVPPTDIWWVATVGEEGLGDLRGIRRATDDLKDRIGVAIILEGIGLGRVYQSGLGVRRLRVSASGPGGHSWLHAERPSAIHHLLRLGAALVDNVHPSEQPRTSFNIGLIEGGTSINTRAAHAALAIDMRSVDGVALSRMEAAVREIVHLHSGDPSIEVETEVVGDRPSACLSPQHGLVQAASAVLISLGYPTPTPEIGSTDANIPLAAGIPAVCVGITTGGNAHTVNEYIDVDPVAHGMEQLGLLTLLACRNVADWRTWVDN